MSAKYVMKYFEFADKLKPKHYPKYSKYGNGLQINMCANTIDLAMSGYFGFLKLGCGSQGAGFGSITL
jgi:hypothetical protein